MCYLLTMTMAWVTSASPDVEAMVNPLNAACEHGFVPDEIYILEDRGIEEKVNQAIDLIMTIITAYGEDEPEISKTPLTDEVAFDVIYTHVKDAIKEVKEKGGEVAVDITPGRKFMSAIAFAAGMRYEADHVYYFYTSTGYFKQLYPNIPRTATQLFDFTEEL